MGALSTLITAVSLAPQMASMKELSKSLDRLKKSNFSVSEIKKVVSSELNKHGKQIVVIVDDIDRSTSEEIRELFRTIKTLTDFPYMTYLLAFDKEIVSKALDSIHEGKGAAYLEKIVQVHFELPYSGHMTLGNILMGQLRDFDRGNLDSLNEQHFLDVFNWIALRIRTTREINRFVNSLVLKYPLIEEEMNFADFVGMEAIRFFEPTVYGIIEKNLRYFVELDALHSPGSQDIINFYKEWLAAYPETERQQIEEILCTLFPNLSYVLDRPSTNLNDGGPADLRIYNPEIADLYFDLGLPEDGISVIEFRALLAARDDVEKLATYLLQIAQEDRLNPRVNSFLERLDTYIDEGLNVDHARNIAFVLFQIGDTLSALTDDANFVFRQTTLAAIQKLLSSLYQYLNETDREVFLSAIQQGNSLATIIRFVASLELAMPANDMFRYLALDKIVFCADKGELLDRHQLSLILRYWRKWGQFDEVQQWVFSVSRTDDEFVKFIARTRSDYKTFNPSTHEASLPLEIDFTMLEEFFGREELVGRSQGVLASPVQISDDEREMLQKIVAKAESPVD